MRTNKKAMIATFIISISSFVICAFLFNQTTKPFWYDISLASFGSALLGCVVAYTAYSAERRKAMESFWQECFNFIGEIRKLKFLKIEEPIYLIRDCIEEEYGINIIEETNNKAKDALIEWIEENRHPDDGEPDYSKKLDIYYHNLIKSYRKQLTTVMQTYVVFSQTNLQPLMNAYGSLDFIIANHGIREKAYESIYKKIENIHSLCQQNSKVFELAIRGNAHLLNAFDKVLIINHLLYAEKEDDMIYAELADDLDQRLEWFRSKIYHVEPKKLIPIPYNYKIDFDETNSVFRNERKESILATSVVFSSPFEEW